MQRLIGTARQVPPALKTWWGSIEEFESAMEVSTWLCVLMEASSVSLTSAQVSGAAKQVPSEAALVASARVLMTCPLGCVLLQSAE
jgi:hypothetical protein